MSKEELLGLGFRSLVKASWRHRGLSWRVVCRLAWGQIANTVVELLFLLVLNRLFLHHLRITQAS